MNRLRHVLAGLVLSVVAVAAPPRAVAQTSRPPFGEGTHAFRRILHDLEMEPLDSVRAVRDPPHTLLVVLGETDVLDQLPGGLRGFLARGGAALVATDRQVPVHRLLNPFGVTVNGTQVRLESGGLLSPVRYRDFDECPLLQPVRGASPDLLGLHVPGVPAGVPLGRVVATNRPSYLTVYPKLPGSLQVLATLPPGCRRAGVNGLDSMSLGLPPFAVGGTVGPGRLLVLADHSLFINDMMLQPDTDNVDFTYNCLDWLTAGKPKGTHVLFVEEGDVQTAFDIPLKEVPLPLPPLDSLVPLADDVIQQMEAQNAFNEVLLDLVPFEQLWVALVVLLSGLLAVYGLYRLLRARHRVDPAAPLLDRLLAAVPAAGSVMEQRHRALLGRGNLWEPARALARQCFAVAGIAGTDGRPAPPHVRVTGSWWQQRTLGRLVRRLWHLAYASRPVPVSPQEFARLPAEVEEVRAALASGVLELRPAEGNAA
jgi:hypothetical protein